MKLWFSADTHFNHANILKYVGRTEFMTKEDKELYEIYKNKSQEEQRKFAISFESLDKMNKELIRRWNERVKPEDLVIFVGDFIFKNSPGGKKGEGLPIKPTEIEKKLNGKILFCKGNHDGNNGVKTPIERLVIRYGGKRINIVHNPAHVDPNYKINLVGHVHLAWQIKRIKTSFGFTDAINVGVDCWNFYPVSFEEIMKRYYKWKRKQEHGEQNKHKKNSK